MRLVTPTPTAMEKELREAGYGYRIDSPEERRRKAEYMFKTLQQSNENWKNEDWTESRRVADRNRPDVELKR